MRQASLFGKRRTCRPCYRDHAQAAYERKKVYKAERYASTSGRAKYLVRQSRARAKKRGLHWDLKPTPIKEALERGRCALTGIAFDLSPSDNRGPNPFAPSLDRIDSSKGYTHDNVQVVCHCVNQLKGALTMTQLRDVVGALIRWQGW